MGSIGTTEILLIALVVLLLFGAKRIPEIARGLGKGIREFKDATHDIQREIQFNDPPNRVQPPRAPQQGHTAARGTHEADVVRPDVAHEDEPRQAPLS